MSVLRTCYSKILVFVKELKTVFPREEVKLYYKLLKQTSVDNETALEKHVDIWKNWLSVNKDVIIAGNIGEISNDPITFSKRVYIPLYDLIQEADKSTKATICKHCQLICYILWPSEDLKTALVANPSQSSETVFMDNFFDKVENSFKNKQFSNPLEATMEIFQSGMFNELVEGLTSGIENNTLDANKMYDSLTGMMSSMGLNPSGGNFMNMVNGMMQSSSGASGDVPPNPLAMMGQMLGGSGGGEFNPLSMMSGLMNSGLNPMDMLGSMMQPPVEE